MMKERPILFSAPMVMAILDGSKTQTRRILKNQPYDVKRAFMKLSGTAYVENKHGVEVPLECCKYGQAGDRLWVRETYWQAGKTVFTYPGDDEGSWSGSKRVLYSADGNPPNEPNRHYPSGLRNGHFSAADPNRYWRKRPSIHMPRWASRINLEVTGVRVERLQDISDDDCLAEGSENSNLPGIIREKYKQIWQSINGAGSWDKNPWVWVIEFKRLGQ